MVMAAPDGSSDTANMPGRGTYGALRIASGKLRLGQRARERMAMADEDAPVVTRMMMEQQQAPDTRRPLLQQIRKELGRPVMSFFTSFHYPVMIEDDVDMLEAVLQKLDLKDGLALIINSPGGDGLEAERIIQVCRSYSKTGEYWAIVPSKAKSAATMICLGASKIIMSPTSELGPIDPQLTRSDKDDAAMVRRLSVCNIVKSYDSLFQRATRAKGRLEPFLQQLAHYNEMEIVELRSAIDLSKDIAVRSLASGMMKGQSAKQIEKRISVLLSPKQTKSHGRPIYAPEAQACGLRVDVQDVSTPLWRAIYELYLRTDNFVSTRAYKCVESSKHAFFVSSREART
ncbi:MAG: hypothetical protein EPN53_11200 [Acidobacteria bacterium]|nr:MAG: hypothetical protein EPN53_11200 [Acidobacteriota bacterium]